MAASSGQSTLPWVEKYRPTVLKDVIGNSETIARLEVIAIEGNMPHLIISGPPGTGKTTSVLCLARQMLGDSTKEGVLELNASDDRGIETVRNKIKMFAQQKVTLPAGRQKIIILDEADSMTSAAQQALRRTMEIYSSTTRFALACNDSSKIIEPIQSRCAILRYMLLTDQQILKRITDVAKMEHVPYDDEGMATIVFTASGDMRQALNNLQSTYSGHGLVNKENVLKVCDLPHPETVKAIIDNCVFGSFNKANEKLESLWYKGYAASDIITTFFRVVKSYEMKDQEALKLEYLREIGFVHMRSVEGCNSLLQLSGLCAKMYRIAREKNIPKRIFSE